jgi:hypothetical protein
MKTRILRSPADLNHAELRNLYAAFNLPVTRQDCGQMCAPYNSTGKPFCCDICHAIPAAYASEWNSLKSATELWHPWQADECTGGDQNKVAAPAGMLLLACLGPQGCQRENRLLSCRQFPFFPYVTSDYRFLGLTYDWEFEGTCWVISNLGLVSEAYRREFVRTYDQLFAWFQEEFDSYADRSEEMRTYFAAQKRRIPLLHRDGGFHLLSPGSERIRRVEAARLPKFGPYR